MKTKNIKLLVLSLLILLSAFINLSAQETTVVGQVLNKVDKSPISNVSIYYKNSTVGTKSDDEGYFMIRTNGNYKTLVFSAVGFRNTEIHIKPGQSIGTQIELDEENMLLQEVFVIPGANPALIMMRKMRLLRSENDASRHSEYKMKSTEQNLVLLNKLTQRSISKRLFNQLRKGSLSSSDSALVLPLYMTESNFLITAGKKEQLSKNTFTSPDFGEKIIEKLVGEMDVQLNFYENAITVFGKSLVSPLSSVGNAYYNYYLADSLKTTTGKQYEIHFRTKNSKNLAFNGLFLVDSSSYALTGIEAELPVQANINFIRNLHISQKFSLQSNNYWFPQFEEMALNMNYELLADSLHQKPEIFVKRSATFQFTDTLTVKSDNFAQSDYTQTNLNDKLKDLNNTPILRTAKWIADVIFTGYIPVGKIDIGKIQQTIRITDIEGLRMTLPLRTNEKLWKNISLGGFVGYGFKNNIVKYSGQAQFKIPGEKRRVLSFNYTDDYRRIDYNYNGFMFRENPLVTGDEDISSSVFGLRSAGKMSERNEYSISFTNEWNADIESIFFVRSNKLIANNSLPLLLNGINAVSFLQQQSATFTTRYSFGEKTYDDHMQRIYIANKKPVIYSIIEVGRYQFGNQLGKYGKIMASMKHLANLGFAELNYNAEAGIVIGNVPYPLLEIPSGSETGGYSTYQFNMMNYMEYAADKYINLHSELTFNGQLMNQIPLIKHLNLREICSFNISYGGLRDAHKSLLDFPAYLNPLSKPYMEVGVGFSNIFKIFTLQSVWRLTDLNHPEVSPWGLRGCLRLSF
ncbi:MAG: carboxypeptidase-like regulatory domain-containing protein [Paludibacter sp.]|nr:carboxypeptidase-like regulatory domain-containing protein [Paludibacter sp.]